MVTIAVENIKIVGGMLTGPQNLAWLGIEKGRKTFLGVNAQKVGGNWIWETNENFWGLQKFLTINEERYVLGAMGEHAKALLVQS